MQNHLLVMSVLLHCPPGFRLSNCGLQTAASCAITLIANVTNIACYVAAPIRCCSPRLVFWLGSCWLQDSHRHHHISSPSLLAILLPGALLLPPPWVQVEQLLSADSGIVRHRGKVQSAISNAR